MSNQEFKKLFIDELQDIYSAENQIVQALPNVINAVESQELKDAFSNHLQETKQQVKRLETIFSQIGENRGSETCESMQGLIQETQRYIDAYPMSLIRDAAIIAAVQRIEHYEISVYGTLCTFAKQLEFDDAINLLEESLEEEKNADETLTHIATGGFFTSGVNKKAFKSK